MTGQGGWPMTVVCTPDGRPFFAGTYFPKERRGGMIGFVELCERIDELWHTQRDDLLEQADQLTGALGRSALVVPARRACPTAERRRRARSTGSLAAPATRSGAGSAARRSSRSRWRMEALAAAASPGRRAGARAPLTTHARRHGRRRHLRPPRRRLRPLRRRRRVARPPLREDALRQRAADPPLPARLAAHRRGRGSARCSTETIELRAPRPAPARRRRRPRPRTPTARAWRASSTCGPTREVREVLGEDADVARHWYGFRPGGNFEHGTTIPNRMHARGELARPPEVEAARQALFDARADARPPGARRQGAHRVERLPRRGAGRGRAPRPASPRGSTRRSRRPSSCSPTCAAPTAAGCGPGRPTPAPGTSPTPPTTAPSSTRSPGWPRPPARPAGSPRPAPPPTRCSTCSGTPSTAACSPPATTPRRSSPAPRT